MTKTDRDSVGDIGDDAVGYEAIAQACAKLVKERDELSTAKEQAEAKLADVWDEAIEAANNEKVIWHPVSGRYVSTKQNPYRSEVNDTEE